MAGEATPAQIAGLLMAMRVRGETVAELTGAVRAMRARMARRRRRRPARSTSSAPAATTPARSTSPPPPRWWWPAAACRWPSTATARCPRAPAPPTCWPRSASTSTCRSTGCRRCCERAGMVFLMAPRHHAAMRHAAGPRVELGTRTIFNLLGPLANPARVQAPAHRRLRRPPGCAPWPRPSAAWAPSAPGWCTARAWTRSPLSGETQVVALEDGGLREFTVVPGGCRPPPRPAGGGARRRPGGERRGAGGVAAGSARALPRHRPAERRRRPGRGGPRRAISATARRWPRASIDSGAGRRTSWPA